VLWCWGFLFVVWPGGGAKGCEGDGMKCEAVQALATLRTGGAKGAKGDRGTPLPFSMRQGWEHTRDHPQDAGRRAGHCPDVATPRAAISSRRVW
jgi:hypothetical protein